METTAVGRLNPLHEFDVLDPLDSPLLLYYPCNGWDGSISKSNEVILFHFEEGVLPYEHG
jgi:hypothetical protein